MSNGTKAVVHSVYSAVLFALPLVINLNAPWESDDRRHPQRHLPLSGGDVWRDCAELKPTPTLKRPQKQILWAFFVAAKHGVSTASAFSRAQYPQSAALSLQVFQGAV
jgi:hypothetical protein